MRAVYKLADIPVEVCSLYGEVHEKLADYSTEEAPLFSVTISPRDIEQESARMADYDRQLGFEPRNWRPSYLEVMVVYRFMADRFYSYQVILLHGSAIAVDGEAYLFTAQSGTGKSTHTRFWRELFGERAVMVNDDKPLIRVRADGQPMIYGTPYDGKHHLSNPIAVPLKAICLLERGKENVICPAETGESLPRLMEALYRPKDPAALAGALGVLDQVLTKTKFYRLSCNMDPEAARISYEGMR